MRTGWICLMITVLGSLAAPGPDSQGQSSWLESLMSSLDGKRAAEPLPGAEFWGVRGKRSAAPQQLDVEALDQEDKRSLKPNSLFGSLNKKSLKDNPLFEYLKNSRQGHSLFKKPNYLFNSMGKRTLKPNSLFGAIGKRSLKPNSLFGAFGKKSLKPNSLFGTYGKRLPSIKPNSLFASYSKRNFKPNGLFSIGQRSQMKPNGLFAMSKRSIMPTHWLLEGDAAEEEGNNYSDFESFEEVEDEDALDVKRSVDPSFWAARGKRAGLEALDDFFAARGRRADELSAPAFDFFAARG